MKTRQLIIFTTFVMMMAGCSEESSDADWNNPVIPVSLKGIETVNIDNSGEMPVVSAAPIKKEAYMVGIKWIADNVPAGGDDDKFITGPIAEGEQVYGSIAAGYSKAIRCNTAFNADIPAGEYVSKYFKEIDREYLPVGVDEGFVLLVAPQPGEHSFRVEYYKNEELVFFHDTPLINFF